MKKYLIATTFCFGLIFPVFSAPPENADQSLAPFYRSLKIPGSNTGCCDINDCRPVKIRIFDGKLQVFITKEDFNYGTNEWVDVPSQRVLEPRENPVGEPIACWNPYLGVMCFLNGSGV